MKQTTPYIYIILLLISPVFVWAQRDSIPSEVPDINQNILEDVLQNAEEDADFEFNTIFEQLELYAEKPLNLNKASESEIVGLGLLSDIQVYNFLKYRKEVGELIAIFELQAIPELDLTTIRRILPYVKVSGDVDDFQVSIKEMLTGGKDELYVRWSRVLEERRGFRPLAEGETSSRYLGDPNKLYVRYKHSYDNKLSYGFTAEKDAGEEFFTGSNKAGFDYYSAHIFLKDYKKNIKAIALGDYSVSMGQGLVLYSGFGVGKSSFTTLIKRGTRTLRPYSSVNENSFLRGAGTTLAFGDHIELTAFGSLNKRDGNALERDTLDVNQEFLEFSSLQTSGFHRTPNEIADKKIIQQFTLGGSLKYKFNGGHVALNTLFDKFDRTLTRRPQLYNQFYFSGDRLLNMSVDYSYIYKNMNFFGETAYSDNGAIATINGLLLGLDKKVDMALLHRYFPRDYQAIIANPFSEGSGGRNESGFYMGLMIKPNRNWEIASYYDMYSFPWLRFQVDAPSRGYDFLGKITYTQRRKLRAYVQVRYENKEINAPNNTTKADILAPFGQFQTRLYFSNNVSKVLELRSRFDFGFSDKEGRDLQKGMMFYQDIIYKSPSFPVSFSTRFAIFDTDGYDVRFYAYESNLLYTFSIPAYYHQGTRFYLNAKYRPTRNLTLELRYSQTYWRNQENFGSGLEEIEGQRRSEVNAQIRYRF